MLAALIGAGCSGSDDSDCDPPADAASGLAQHFNPIHYDQSFAQQAGLEGVIAHGMLTMAFLGQLVTDWAWPDNEVVSLSTRFRAITVPGDEITCTGTVGEKREADGKRFLDLELEAKNQNEEVTATGKATVAVS